MTAQLHRELRDAFDLAARSVGDAQDASFARFVRALERLVDLRVAKRLSQPTPPGGTRST
jgi:hypothetical protein